MLRVYNFKDMSGIVTVEQNGHEFEFNLYGEDKCNCFLATVWEYPGLSDSGQKEYALQWFFIDEGHGKRMLGLAKGADGTKTNWMTDVKKLTLYKKQCANWKKIMNMFAQAFDNLTIEIKEEK